MLIRYHCSDGTTRSEFFESYAESKLDRLERLPFNVSKVDIATSKEGPFFTVDICIQGMKEVRASASTADLMESLDRALDKAVSQITRLKLSYRESRREKKKFRRHEKHQIMDNDGFLPDKKKTA